MNLKRFLLLALIVPSFSNAQDFYKQGNFIVKGQVNNLKEEFIEFSLTNYLVGTSSSIRIKPNGSFEQKIPVQNRQSLTLVLNNEPYFFHVLDGDTLSFIWDEANFKSSFWVKGNNDLRTGELQLELKLHSKSFTDYGALIEYLGRNKGKLTAEQQFEKINTAYNQHVKAVFASVNSYSVTPNDLITGLYFDYSRLLQTQNLVPNYKLKLNLDSIETYPYFDMSNSLYDYTFLNVDWFWNVPEYRQFIYNYVRFYKPPFRNAGGSSTAINAVKKPFNPTLDEYYLAQSNFVYTDIKDWFITKLIIDCFGSSSFTEVEKVYQQYINTCTVPFLKDTLQKYYTAIKRLRPGKPAPGFSLKNDKGQTVALNDFKGKVVYIDFWGISCSPCIYDIKNYVPALHKKYKDKQIVFINICMDAKENDWKEALTKYQLDGINLIAKGWTNNPVCKAYNINIIPHYILIDKNGKIANNNAPHADALTGVSNENPIDLLLK
jgi:peroxiredoxin